MQHAEKSLETGPVIILVGAQNTGEAFLTVEGDPGKLAAVIIEEAGGQTHSPSGSHIRKRCIVVFAVEIVKFPCADQPVLDSFQCGRRTSANHQGLSIQIFFSDQVFFCQGIIPPGDQVNMALKQIMHTDSGNLFCLFF